jgi:hypothetical protein
MLNSGPDTLSLNLVLRLLAFATENEIKLSTRKSLVTLNSKLPHMELQSMRERMKTVQVPHLPEWFATFHSQGATNPSDRIFAYLGLAKEALPFPPRTTYKKDSIERVWAEGTELALCRYNDVDFICLGRGRYLGVPGHDYTPLNPEERGKTEYEDRAYLNLPSWVPDFGCSEGDGLSSACKLPLSYYPRVRSAFNASGGVRTVMSVNEALTELQVLGLHIDKIKRISTANLSAIDGTQGVEFLEAALDIMANIYDTPNRCVPSCFHGRCNHYPGPRGRSYFVACCKTLVMGP